MVQNKSAVIQQFDKTRASVVASSRFFNNEHVRIEDLIECSKEHCREWSKGREVVVIHDTTDYNYWHHRGRIQPGTLGALNDTGLGYYAHCGLVIDAQDDFPLGYSYMKVWTRPAGQPNKEQRQYRKLAIEEKESFRWIEAIEQSQQVLSDANNVTYIADRECDIFELWDRCGAHGKHLIIRARADRRIKEAERLFAYVDTLPVRGEVDIEIKENKKSKRSKHHASLEIKWAQVTFIAPANKQGEDVTLWVVEAKESSQTVQEGEPPVHWILLTTRQITHMQTATGVITDYTKRWWVEVLFSVTKTRGVNVEESQMEHGQALMKLGAIAFQAALQILQFKHQREGKDAYSMRLVFDGQREKLVEKLMPEWEGQTAKQKNPYKQKTLARAAWLIARLGGWKGYKSESPPGVRTFSNGLKRFEDMFTVYQIVK